MFSVSVTLCKCTPPFVEDREYLWLINRLFSRLNQHIWFSFVGTRLRRRDKETGGKGERERGGGGGGREGGSEREREREGGGAYKRKSTVQVLLKGTESPSRELVNEVHNL